MGVEVRGTEVVLRLATDDEVRAVALTRHGRDFDPSPSRSFKFTAPARPLADDEVYVVSQAFVELTDGGVSEPWDSDEHHGHSVSVRRDVTLELLRLAEETAGDLVELLGDMRIGGRGVSRWQLMSAPRRVVLAPGLLARLAPLRRG